MNRVLLAGFDGKNNSARVITERISSDCRKLILPNDRSKSSELLMNEINSAETGVVILLGQKPCIKDKIAVEPTAALCGETLHTTLDVTVTAQLIRQSGYAAYISRGCGTSYCNHIYFQCLKSGVNCIFLHVPTMDNISDIKALTKAIEGFVNGIAGVPAML
ncbi:MAG: hypothetical protein E7478_00545 [Ruminococcaceae bacterium]|nr:hypothetical protein [Oscillospiraceae bacterium]